MKNTPLALKRPHRGEIFALPAFLVAATFLVNLITAQDAVPSAAAEEPKLPEAKLSFQIPSSTLTGPHSGQQLVATNEATARHADVTAKAKFTADPANIIAIDSHGYVTPLADGTATVRATLPNHTGAPATMQVTVKNFETESTLNFSHEVVPVFTKYGCNGGGCHGKSGGQNNFRLSLLGYEPWNDHEWLVRESRGRRISPAAPENSLLLLKATGEIPHEGGIRLERDSTDYNTIVRWIKQGLPYAADDAPHRRAHRRFPDGSSRHSRSGTATRRHRLLHRREHSGHYPHRNLRSQSGGYG